METKLQSNGVAKYIVEAGPLTGVEGRVTRIIPIRISRAALSYDLCNTESPPTADRSPSE